MSTFVKGGGVSTPFGKNEYLRSTNPKPRFESYTVAAASVPVRMIDGTPQKILQPGTVMAKITSGPDAGKIGPFMAAGTAEVNTITKGGTWSGGTYTLTVEGKTTGNIAYNAVAADIQSALTAAGVNDITVSGGPLSTTAVVLTWATGFNQGNVSIDTTNVTGSTPTASVAETTPGTPGSVDGRATTSNIVGLNDTFLPWQLLERDVEVAVAYDSVMAVQAWCLEYTVAGGSVPQALTNTTADAMRGNKKLNVNFS